MMGINVEFLQWFIVFLIKKLLLRAYKKFAWRGIKSENMPDQQLAEALRKSTITNFKTRKVHSTFIGNIWGADLADMQLISKFDKGFSFLLCVIDIYSKYTCAIPLKDKKRITIINAFQKFQMNQNATQIKYWLTKAVNCKID